MALFKKPEALSPAAAAIAKYTAAREKLEAKHAELTGELHQLEISLPTAQLADLVNDTMECRPTIQRIASIREELTALESARRPCEVALLESMRAKNREDAIGLRQQASAVQAELDAHLAKRTELYKALSDFAGADFIECTEASMDVLRANEAARYRSEQVTIRISHARVLHHKIQALLGQADELERRQVSLPDLPASNVVSIALAS